MSDSRNPYIKNPGDPLLQASVIAFLDILGYKNMVLDAEEQGTSQGFLSLLHGTLKASVEHLRYPLGKDDKIFKSPILEKDLHKVVSFTDNIVIGYPIEDDAEMEIGLICNDLANFQLTMVKAGFFVRGAISIGNSFIDDFVVYGKGLVDAYEGELNSARDPRIILTGSVQDTVKRHLKYYANPTQAPQTRTFFKDADGQYFINYLEEIMIAEAELGPDFETLMQHKKVVKQKLSQHSLEPPIWSKYAWVANYHNFFCDRFASISNEYKIDMSSYQISPSSII